MVRSSIRLDDVDVDSASAAARRPFPLETPWPADRRSGVARDEVAAQGDLRAYTVGDWLLILLRLATASAIAVTLVAALTAVLGAPLWLAIAALS